jgi:hypothetical protein
MEREQWPMLRTFLRPLFTNVIKSKSVVSGKPFKVRGDSSTTNWSTGQPVDSVNWSTGLRADNSSTPTRRLLTGWQGYKFSQLVDKANWLTGPTGRPSRLAPVGQTEFALSYLMLALPVRGGSWQARLAPVGQPFHLAFPSRLSI